MPMPPFYFFLPCDESAFQRMPKRLADYSAWQHSETAFTPFLGRYHWVLQTYLQLLEAGVAAQLVRELPREGVIFSHVECLDYGTRPTSKTMLVPMLVDKDVPMPYGAVHVTHNPVQRLPLRLRQHYMPPWPQIGLLPRATERGDTFRNVGFIGFPENLHPDLVSERFMERLASLGLRLIIPPPTAWHDFREIDAVLAVRNFGRSEQYLNKPALKLYNAWAAGVPAVLGYESAYRSEGSPDLDYLEATDSQEVILALERLASSPPLRAQLVGAGARKMQARTEVELRSLWTRLLSERVAPLYAQWIQDPVFRTSFRIGGAVRQRLLWRKPAWFSELH